MHRLGVEPGDHLGEERVALAAQELVVRVLEAGDEDQILASPRLLAIVAQHGAKDPVDPWPRVGLIPEIGEADPCPDARFLNGVFGVGHRVGSTDGEGEQSVEMRQDHRFEAGAEVGGGFAEGREHGSRDEAGGGRRPRSQYSVRSGGRRHRGAGVFPSADADGANGGSIPGAGRPASRRSRPIARLAELC